MPCKRCKSDATDVRGSVRLRGLVLAPKPAQLNISLLYSGEAGDGVAPGRLRRAFEAAGHELLYATERDTDFERELDDSTELVVAAGGDGTVRRAARALLGRGIPLAILPCGTANNVAISLGIEGELSQLIAGWDRARR